MTQEVINVGAIANDGTGDAWRTAMQKCNSNFTELYATAGSSGGFTPQASPVQIYNNSLDANGDDDGMITITDAELVGKSWAMIDVYVRVEGFDAGAGTNQTAGVVLAFHSGATTFDGPFAHAHATITRLTVGGQNIPDPFVIGGPSRFQFAIPVAEDAISFDYSSEWGSFSTIIINLVAAQ